MRTAAPRFSFDPDRAERRSARAESLRPNRDRPARLHRERGSSRRSSTSCSTILDRIRSRASWSARPIISLTSARTSWAVSGFHSRSFESSFIARASISVVTLLYRWSTVNVFGAFGTPNRRMHTNRGPAFRFRCCGSFGRWIGCQRAFPAAIGDPLRWATL
jgi:hypothetical protein